MLFSEISHIANLQNKEDSKTQIYKWTKVRNAAYQAA